jgi:glutathione peroxidase
MNFIKKIIFKKVKFENYLFKMGVMLDLYKKGNYVENPYQNFFEIKAKDFDHNLTRMDKYYTNALLVVHLSPCDKKFNQEFEKLLALKNSFKDAPFEILAFPSCQLDNIELSDLQMKEKLLSQEMVNKNMDKIKMFNRVYVNGEETCEVMKFCYRNSPLFMFREAKAKPIDKNFSKFLITRNGTVYSYFPPEVESEEIEKNIKYVTAQKLEKIKVRHDFINFNKFY